MTLLLFLLFPSQFVREKLSSLSEDRRGQRPTGRGRPSDPLSDHERFSGAPRRFDPRLPELAMALEPPTAVSMTRSRSAPDLRSVQRIIFEGRGEHRDLVDGVESIPRRLAAPVEEDAHNEAPLLVRSKCRPDHSGCGKLLLKRCPRDLLGRCSESKRSQDRLPQVCGSLALRRCSGVDRLLPGNRRPHRGRRPDRRAGVQSRARSRRRGEGGALARARWSSLRLSAYVARSRVRRVGAPAGGSTRTGARHEPHGRQIARRSAGTGSLSDDRRETRVASSLGFRLDRLRYLFGSKDDSPLTTGEGSDPNPARGTNRSCAPERARTRDRHFEARTIERANARDEAIELEGEWHGGHGRMLPASAVRLLPESSRCPGRRTRRSACNNA